MTGEGRRQTGLAGIVLIAMNLIPLIGVLTLGWDAATIVFLYWLENVVIGVLNIPKILSCTGKSSEAQRRATGLGGRLYLAVFFSVHYGLFAMAHYTILRSLFDTVPDVTDPGVLFGSSLLIVSVAGLAISHTVSMVVNFYGRREYASRAPNTQMFMPYTRLVVLHVVIIVGAVVAERLGSGIGVLIALVLIKTGVDLVAHRTEHAPGHTPINPGVT